MRHSCLIACFAVTAWLLSAATTLAQEAPTAEAPATESVEAAEASTDEPAAASEDAPAEEPVGEESPETEAAEPTEEAPTEDAPTEDAPEPDAESTEATTEGEATEAEATEAQATEDNPVAEDPADEDIADVEPSEDETADEEAAEEAVADTDWNGLIERAPAFFALLHNAAVHLPIALWLFGALFVLIGALVPSWRTQIPLACLIGGAITSVGATATGWWNAEYEYGSPLEWEDEGFGEWSEVIVQHRWLAVALMLVSLLLSVMALVSQAKKSKTLGVLWRVGLLGLAAAVAWEGHLGGELLKSEDFLDEAFEVWVTPEE